MTDRELMQAALEALEVLAKYENPLTKIQVRKPRDGGPIVTVYPKRVAMEAAAPLRERLAQPEQTVKDSLTTAASDFFAWFNKHYPEPSQHPAHEWNRLGVALAKLEPTGKQFLQVEQPNQSPLDRADGELFVRSSKMTRAEGLFMAEKAKQWTMFGGLE